MKKPKHKNMHSGLKTPKKTPPIFEGVHFITIEQNITAL